MIGFDDINAENFLFSYDNAYYASMLLGTFSNIKDYIY